MSELIKHVIVISFHHTQGNKIEYAYPEITPKEYIDHKYDNIPFLAIPGTNRLLFNVFILIISPVH